MCGKKSIDAVLSSAFYNKEKLKPVLFIFAVLLVKIIANGFEMAACHFEFSDTWDFNIS